MSNEGFKCGCKTGYREVVTGNLKSYAAGVGGVALEIAMDPCGTMYVGCNHDEAWAKANMGKHLVVTITQFPEQGPQVVDIGILEGRASELARKAARVGGFLGVMVLKVGDGQWHVHIPKGAVPGGHPILEALDSRDVVPLTDDQLGGLDANLQKLKRDHESGIGDVDER